MTTTASYHYTTANFCGRIKTAIFWWIPSFGHFDYFVLKSVSVLSCKGHLTNTINLNQDNQNDTRCSGGWFCIITWHFAKRFLRRRLFYVLANQKQKSSQSDCFLSDQDKMRKLHKWSSIDAQYQILIHLAKWFQRRRFLMYHQISKKNCPWLSLFSSDCGYMRKLYKGLSIPILIHLA